jgi:hypothetical protein
MGFSNANVSKILVIRLWAVIGNNMVEGFKFNSGIRASNYAKEDNEWEYYISFDNMFVADSIGLA